MGVVLIGFVYWIATVVLAGGSLMKTASLIMLLYIIAVLFLVNGVKELLKRKKTPRGVNSILTLLSSFALSFGMMGVITFGLIRATQNGFFERGRETYEYNGATFNVYMDELPLTVEDLLDIQYDGYIRERRSNESLLLGQFKFPFLYDFCKNSLLNDKKDEVVDGETVFADRYEQVDAFPWRANEAYRRYWSGGYTNCYLLCYENRITEIAFFWEPTSGQMAIVADKLSGEW